MKSVKVDTVIRNFLLNEGQMPSLRSRLVALEELLSKVEGKSLTEARRLEIIREQVRGIKKEVRILEEDKRNLEEKIKLLEEGFEE